MPADQVSPWPLRVLLFIGLLILLLIHAPYILWNAVKFEWDKT